MPELQEQTFRARRLYQRKGCKDVREQQCDEVRKYTIIAVSHVSHTCLLEKGTRAILWRKKEEEKMDHEHKKWMSEDFKRWERSQRDSRNYVAIHGPLL